MAIHGDSAPRPRDNEATYLRLARDCLSRQAATAEDEAAKERSDDSFLARFMPALLRALSCWPT